MIYGYIRVSSRDQKIDRQYEELKKLNIDDKNIFIDKESGKDFERKSYKRLIKKLKPNDTLVIKSIDRLGRNYDMIIEEWSKITKDIGASIKVIDMPLLDTSSDNDLMGKFISDIVLQILSFVAENERTAIKQRQAEGIKIAMQKGIKFGRPRVELPENHIEIFNGYLCRDLSCDNAMKLLEISRGTFFKLLKNYKKIIVY